jgi:outer membrane protein
MVSDGVDPAQTGRCVGLLIVQHRHMNRPLRACLVGMMIIACASAAPAQDLLQIWAAAQQHDPQLQSHRAARAAGATQAQLAQSLWRPQVALGMTAGWAHAQSQMSGAQFAMPGAGAQNGASFATSVDGGTATHWQVNLRQSLYSPQKAVQSTQLDMATQASEETWRWMQQEWLLQTAQRYFDAVVAEQRLRLVQQQQLAVERGLAQAKERFEVGDAPATDVHEAQARAQALAAEAVEAADGLLVARQVLADVTLLSPDGLNLLAPTDGLSAINVGPEELWLPRAQADNPMLKVLRQQLNIAQQEVKKHHVMASPSLDLMAQSARDRLSGTGEFGAASNTQTQHWVGLSLTLPLYAGGARQAKLQEAIHGAEKAQAELARAEMQVRQMTRATWQLVQSSPQRLVAWEAALTAGRARLDATLLAQQVGARTTLDVLNAQNEVQAMALNALRARVDLLLGQLRLHALAGSLDGSVLQMTNAWLAMAP